MQGMNDDMKDSNLFPMTHLLDTNDNLMDMEMITHSNSDPLALHTNNVKQEGTDNNTNMLPPDIQNSMPSNYPLASNTNNIYNSTFSNSPPQSSPMFMDHINPNSSIYNPSTTDYNVCLFSMYSQYLFVLSRINF